MVLKVAPISPELYGRDAPLGARSLADKILFAQLSQVAYALNRYVRVGFDVPGRIVGVVALLDPDGGEAVVHELLGAGKDLLFGVYQHVVVRGQAAHHVIEA